MYGLGFGLWIQSEWGLGFGVKGGVQLFEVSGLRFRVLGFWDVEPIGLQIEGFGTWDRFGV